MATTNKQSQQQYQLKLGIIHHPSLKTVQLIEFLENQSNQFLHNDLPQYIKGDQKFINVMENFTNDSQQLSEYSFQQYVGLLLIYSTSSQQSYQYFLKNAQSILSLQIGDLFLIAIQMDNSDKQANVIGNQGQRFCTRNSIQFVRLSLYNSEDLINVINRNLYELIENYYYPNEEPDSNNNRDERQLQDNGAGNNMNLQINKQSRQRSRQNSSDRNNNRSSRQRRNNGEFIFSYDQANQSIKAYTQGSQSPSKQKVQQMLSHAATLRKSRQMQISLQQQQIDESISNVQNVLNNINHRIKEKLQSGWFTSIKNNLYMPAQKGNTNYSKIKLTQQFIDQDEPQKQRKPLSSVVQSRYSDVLNKSTKNFALNFNTLKIDAKAFKPAILKIVLFLSRQNVVQLEIYDNSTYEQLASIALKRLNLRQTEKNTSIMIQKIRKRVENFCRQFNKAIRIYEQKKIHERTFLKSKINLEN